MTDDHKLDDSKKGFHKNTDHDSGLLQNKLNAFLEQQDAAMVAAHKQQGTTELQGHLDQFIDKLQGDIDASMEQNTAPSTDRHTLNTPSNRVTYSRLIAIVLIGASCATAAVLWFIWPVEQMRFPQVEKRQQNPDVRMPLAALLHTETLADKVPVTHESLTHESKSLIIKKDRKGMLTPEPKQAAEMPQPPVVNQGSTEKSDLPVAATGVAHARDGIGRKLTVAVSIGNIRSAPDRSGKVLYKLAKGARVTKLAEQNGWFKVRLRNGTIAWAHHSIF